MDAQDPIDSVLAVLARLPQLTASGGAARDLDTLWARETKDLRPSLLRARGGDDEAAVDGAVPLDALPAHVFAALPLLTSRARRLVQPLLEAGEEVLWCHSPSWLAQWRAKNCSWHLVFSLALQAPVSVLAARSIVPALVGLPLAALALALAVRRRRVYAVTTQRVVCASETVTSALTRLPGRVMSARFELAAFPFRLAYPVSSLGSGGFGVGLRGQSRVVFPGLFYLLAPSRVDAVHVEHLVHAGYQQWWRTERAADAARLAERDRRLATSTASLARGSLGGDDEDPVAAALREDEEKSAV